MSKKDKFPNGGLIEGHKYIVTEDVFLDTYHFGPVTQHFPAGTILTFVRGDHSPYDDLFIYLFRSDNGTEYKCDCREMPVDEFQKFELIK